VKIPAPDEQTIWIDKPYGIRDNHEFVRYDDRGFMQKTSDYTQALKHGAEYSWSAGTKRLQAVITGSIPSRFDDESIIGRTGSLGLILLFHGLHGQPSLWDDHLALLAKFPEFDSLALEIPEAGVCSLDEPPFYSLLERIVDWTTCNPQKPIALFGQSNGSRVAAYFETLLREKAPKSPVHVSLTGAVLYGSATVKAVALDKLYDC